MGRKTYDVLVVGGGVYGAAIVREAALRGLSAAIIEARDFCSGASSNSLKIIHGGLRYLQQVDLLRVIESARERRAMLRAAPHLVHPLACVMPTRGCLLKSNLAMRLALLVNDTLSFGRNRGVNPSRQIPNGRLISRAEMKQILPMIDRKRVTGGAVWYDALAYDTERIVVEMVASAVAAGADAANYVKAIRFIKDKNRVTGVIAHDSLTGRDFPLAARLVINSSGAWIHALLDTLDPPCSRPPHGLAVVMNIVLDRQLTAGYAAGLTSRRGRLLFFVPWRGRTMVGTYNRTHEGGPDKAAITEQDLTAFLQDANEAYPGANLTTDNIALIHAGLLPTGKSSPDPRNPSLLRHFRLIDHSPQDGLEGLLTVVGVKYTTARHVAEWTIAKAVRKLCKKCPPSQSAERPLPGAAMADIATFRETIRSNIPAAMPEDTVLHLIWSYGSQYRDVLKVAGTDPALLRPIAESSEVIGAEIVYGVRLEMVQTLADIVFRRTGLGTRGLPDHKTVVACADLMARECGWDGLRKDREIQNVTITPFLR